MLECDIPERSANESRMLEMACSFTFDAEDNLEQVRWVVGPNRLYVYTLDDADEGFANDCTVPGLFCDAVTNISDDNVTLSGFSSFALPFFVFKDSDVAAFGLYDNTEDDNLIGSFIFNMSKLCCSLKCV